MKRKNCCPIAQALGVLGDKWSLIVLRDVIFGKKRHFNDLLASPEKISTNILANRLKTLQEESLLCCCVDAENRRSKIYTPTEKAQDLVPVLVELYKWGEKYNDEVDKVDNPSQAEPF
ncbi:MAG: winged helix-turn-helix transcriptional regulator [Paracoccaceae bacterium]|jgi:DNA-binding HxlR family transcriptional regulator